jgi:hypothetical protein
MRFPLLLFFLLGLSGCVGTTAEQRCYEASKAVAEAIQRTAGAQGFVAQEWSATVIAARQWKDAECTSNTDWLLTKFRNLFQSQK